MTARFGLTPPEVFALPAFAYFAVVAVAVSAADIRSHRIPNRIVYPSYAVSTALIAVASLGGGWAFVRAVAGAAALFAVYLLLAWAVPQGLGFGDVKLAGLIGLHLAWLGWGDLIAGTLLAFLLGGIHAIVLLVLGRAGRGTRIAFGPWMLAGAVGTILLGTSPLVPGS
ncbi:MAG: prepilin peptidase [Burkholderiaceae bacterium]|nr:prepilin peptidase [Microbacteriaceae bacterium]